MRICFCKHRTENDMKSDLKPYAVKNDFEKLCAEASANNFAMVAVNSVQTAVCKEFLKGTSVHVGAAIGFPLGQVSMEVKIFETKVAIADGADEIDYVINIGEAKEGNWDYIRNEMKEMVSLCKKSNVISKVIFEICYLTEEEIVNIAKIAKDVQPDFVKTSTGFGTGGATEDVVRLMKKTVGSCVNVKAAGGIRDWETCAKMIDAGAVRIGTSSSIKILEEFEDWKRKKENNGSY